MITWINLLEDRYSYFESEAGSANVMMIRKGRWLWECGKQNKSIELDMEAGHGIEKTKEKAQKAAMEYFEKLITKVVVEL